MRNVAYLTLLLVLTQGCLPSNSFPSVTIASCYDGDTCITSEGEKIRLACIDTPELRGKRADPAPAKAARDYLRSLVVGKSLRIQRHTEDRYGRTVADLFNDLPIGKLMVDSGHAEIYARYAHQCSWVSGN